MDIVERLRELDKKGYQPLTGAIGEEAAAEIERLHALVKAQKREHTTTADCWCQPEVSYVDPETGNAVYVHREIQ